MVVWQRDFVLTIISKAVVFGLFVLIGLIPMLTSTFIGWLALDKSLFLSIVVQVLGWVVAVLEIGLLSHSYAFLTRRGEREDATTSSVEM